MVKLTYGQMGHRREMFLLAYTYHLKNIMMSQRKKLPKIDFDKFEKVPLPESLFQHIEKNQLNNPLVQKSEIMVRLYKSLIYDKI